MVFDLNKIKSAELNTAFGEFSNDGQPKFNSDSGLLQGLRSSNASHVECKTLSFNYDMVCLSNGPDAQDRVGFTQDPGHVAENYQQIFRVYDDVQVMGYIIDGWGINRPGMQSNFGNAIGAVPGFLAGRQSNAVSFKVTLLGNYTLLDEELGYPSTFKSTEFNLLDDLIVNWENATARLESATTAISAYNLAENYVDNGEYVDINKHVNIQGGSRRSYYPVTDPANAAHLLGGAEYILNVSPLDENDKVVKDALNIPSYHMITSLQVTLVCRCSKRRYS